MIGHQGSVEWLDSLPGYAVVLDPLGQVWQKDPTHHDPDGRGHWLSPHYDDFDGFGYSPAQMLRLIGEGNLYLLSPVPEVDPLTETLTRFGAAPALAYTATDGTLNLRIDSDTTPLPVSPRERVLLRALLEHTLRRLDVTDPEGNLQ